MEVNVANTAAAVGGVEQIEDSSENQLKKEVDWVRKEMKILQRALWEAVANLRSQMTNMASSHKEEVRAIRDQLARVE